MVDLPFLEPDGDEIGRGPIGSEESGFHDGFLSEIVVASKHQSKCIHDSVVFLPMESFRIDVRIDVKDYLQPLLLGRNELSCFRRLLPCGILGEILDSMIRPFRHDLKNVPSRPSHPELKSIPLDKIPSVRIYSEINGIENSPWLDDGLIGSFHSS